MAAKQIRGFASRLLQLMREHLTYHAYRKHVYVRDRGPVCYDTDFAFDADNPEQWTRIPEWLLASGLQWWWCGRRPPGLWRLHPDSPLLPEETPLTHLDPGRARALVDELMEHDVKMWGRLVSIFGLEAGGADGLTKPELGEALRRFALREEPPVRIVLLRAPDRYGTLVFVPHQPVPTVEPLLRQLLPDPVKVVITRPYERLKPHRLEDLLPRLGFDLYK